MVDATEKVLSFRGYPKLEVDGGVFPSDNSFKDIE